jgi:hypothetical protein
MVGLVSTIQDAEPGLWRERFRCRSSEATKIMGRRDKPDDDVLVVGICEP